MTVTAAPAKAQPTPEDRAKAHRDYLWRTPKVRQSMILIVPLASDPNKTGQVAVCENKDTVTLTIEDSNGVNRSVKLTLPEARTVATHLNMICNRIAKRPAHKP
jgi:hypothetical protein